MSDQENQPKSVLDITLADVMRENTANEAADGRRNLGQDLINLRSIQAEADVFQAQADAHVAKGNGVPQKLQTQLTAKLNTLDYQTGLYDQNQRTNPNGLERRDQNALNETMDMDTNQLTSVRETNMRTAVQRVMRDEGVSKFEAMQFITAQIANDGEFAEKKYLPQYHSVKTRLLQRYENSQVHAMTAPTPAAPDQRAEMRQAAQSEMQGLIAQNKSDMAAGHPANTENYIRIEELRKYI